MSEISSDSGVSFETAIPLGWTVENAITAAEKDSRRNTNIALLRALGALESVSAEHEHDKQDAVQKALERVESKLDLVLLMVAGLMRAGAHMPPEKIVTLHSDHAAWRERSDNVPSSGQQILLSLYLSARLPQPLQLSATVTNIETVSNDVARISARFNDTDEEFVEWLTRTIFRYHRRALQARRQP